MKLNINYGSTETPSWEMLVILATLVFAALLPAIIGRVVLVLVNSARVMPLQSGFWKSYFSGFVLIVLSLTILQLYDVINISEVINELDS